VCIYCLFFGGVGPLPLADSSANRAVAVDQGLFRQRLLQCAKLRSRLIEDSHMAGKYLVVHLMAGTIWQSIW